MRRNVAVVALLAATMVYLSCASTGGEFVFQEPEEGKSLLVGGILLEVDGFDDLYQSKTENIIVIIVGKWMEDGQEKTKGYRLKTDEKGYYVLQNVPQGSYLLKGFEADVGYASRFLVTSQWEGNRQRYFPANRMIDHNVRVWPPESTEEVIDLQINYFKLDKAGRILHDRFKACEDAVLGLPDRRYTMANPTDYFKEKYPELGWFK